jgi:acetoin utilization deacetylase AcuC-like enzyme
MAATPTPTPVLISHPSSLDHDTGQHPESIRRIVAIDAMLDELARRGELDYQRVSSPAVHRSVLRRVHPEAHIELIERLAASGGGHIDPDTIVSSGSFRAALHACGGAVELARRLLDGGAGQVGVSLHRPPGHHATTDRAMGFCLFNNIAVAARYALDSLDCRRVLILDWDVHHGNGTEEIFWETDAVLFVSIHQSPLYPGSGRAAELGRGDGYGYTVNLPVPPGSGDGEFVSLVRDVAVPLARGHRPDLILVSAGYDAHRDDPLAECDVTDAGFAAMTALVRDLGLELGVPVGCVLEGGYDTGALARCVALTMRTLASGSADPEAEADALPVHPLASEARQRLAPLWPDITSLT